jgi:hypothetical protein
MTKESEIKAGAKNVAQDVRTFFIL